MNPGVFGCGQTPIHYHRPFIRSAPAVMSCPLLLLFGFLSRGQCELLPAQIGVQTGMKHSSFISILPAGRAILTRTIRFSSDRPNELASSFTDSRHSRTRVVPTGPSHGLMCECIKLRKGLVCWFIYFLLWLKK